MAATSGYNGCVFAMHYVLILRSRRGMVRSNPRWQQHIVAIARRTRMQKQNSLWQRRTTHNPVDRDRRDASAADAGGRRSILSLRVTGQHELHSPGFIWRSSHEGF